MSEAWTYEHAYPIPASPERLFSVLTEREDLERWFAEHVRIERRTGGPFEFWGRYTLGTPARREAGGKIMVFEPGERFGFDWQIFGAPSNVTIDLTPLETERGPATRVRVRHDLVRMFDRPRPREMIDDWWRFNLGNLGAYATGDGEVVRIDFDDPSPEVRVSLYMDAAPEAVFRALTEPEALNRWLAEDAEIELRVGGSYDLGWPVPEGYDGPGMEIVELVPNRRLTITWPDWRGDASVPLQRVTWELDRVGDGTRVTLVHTGFVRAVDVSDFPFGWIDFLDRLKPVAKRL